jgi:hypothetical protein
MNDQPMTRREARELERLKASQPDPVEVGNYFPQSGSTSTVLEHTSLVVEAVPDLNNLSLVLPESGSVLTTGAIELPWLKAASDSETGQVEVIEAAAEADQAATTEVTENVVSGIQPMPARNHQRSRRKASVFPDRLRKGWGVVHLVLISGFVLFALFSAFVASMLLGLIRF